MLAPAPFRNSAHLGVVALLLGTLTFGPMVATAQDGGADGFLSVPEVPSLPGPYEGDSVSAPEVTITETDEEVIYEYRVRGKVYMVKVEPVAGPPYYMMDTNGDGILDVQEEHAPDLSVPQWLLFSW
jgi:hypothetical protein